MWSSSLLLGLRNWGRRIGLNQWIGKTLLSHRDEDRFANVLRNCIRDGDTVWDVGANVGAYTFDFLSKVGTAGRVVAFEPIPECIAQLAKRCPGNSQLVIKNIALGDYDGAVRMRVADDPLSETSRICDSREATPAGGFVQVLACRGDSLVGREPLLFPNVVKIDVEGHEGAVIDGLKDLLFDHRLRCIGIEVHFGVLQTRNESHVPSSMQRTLQAHGFSTRWTDSSHLLASR